jgi:hypothetical protein
MPSKEITVKKMYRAVQLGEERLRNFRGSRLMFIRQYCGQYYDRDHGTIGDEPLNMIFNAMAIIVPNLVSNFPKNLVTSKFLMYRDYGELLALGLDYLAKEISLKWTLRRWIVDAIFLMGIIKTGIATSKDLITFGDNENIDPGTPYAEIVDFDDWILDPAARRIEEAGFVGHRVRVPRAMLLDSGLFRNDLVEQLPNSGNDPYQKREVEIISQHETAPNQLNDLQDFVDVRELWIPGANATIWMPGGQAVYDDYLRVDEYYGPIEGPFSYLMLSNPPPKNPLPVPPVGIWYDLHIMANKMMRKIMDQAERQKDVLGYRRSAADDAQEIIDAGDGEAIALDDPDAVKTYKFGGQEKENEAHLAQLSYWFNMISGNTEQLGGTRSDANTATQANILQANGNVRLEDMRDIVYEGTTVVQRKLAWYLHSDPLIALPMIKRTPIPAQLQMGPNGPFMVPPQIQEQQVILSPDVRQGSFLDFQFTIEQKSMSRLDPATRFQKTLLFTSKVIPSIATATQICMQMGIPFPFVKMIVRLGKEMDIEWLEEIFFDPDLQAQIGQILMQAPQIQGSKGQPSGGPAAGVMQNGQPANIPVIQSPGQQFNSNAQEGSRMAQSMTRAAEHGAPLSGSGINGGIQGGL